MIVRGGPGPLLLLRVRIQFWAVACHLHSFFESGYPTENVT
ncbi:hypothetical protein EC9_47770 [Rosistilla ulvae]|uniref:Uncharacterized protein n=1 Tax=Rosistilla ulvae TaxID=1930277 RepID=A0A517M6S2_9BACT|nr:hypothetical protein EC9_47770 [Rosistilla ulvae]